MEKIPFKLIIGFLSFLTGVLGDYYTFEINNCCANGLRDMDPCCFSYVKPDCYLRVSYSDDLSGEYVFQSESSVMDDNSNPCWKNSSWGFSMDWTANSSDTSCDLFFNIYDADVDENDNYGWTVFGCKELYEAKGQTVTKTIMGPNVVGTETLTCSSAVYRLESAAGASNFTHLA